MIKGPSQPRPLLGVLSGPGTRFRASHPAHLPRPPPRRPRPRVRGTHCGARLGPQKAWRDPLLRVGTLASPLRPERFKRIQLAFERVTPANPPACHPLPRRLPISQQLF